MPRSRLLEVLKLFRATKSVFSKNLSRTYNNRKLGKPACNFAAPTEPNSQGKTRMRFPAAFLTGQLQPAIQLAPLAN
jgi:hypothetical protein